MTVTLKNESLTVLIEDKGAQLCSVKNAAGAEYIWKADPAVWNRHAPLLFPLIGRLQDGEYTVHGQTYHIGSHGFARDSIFTVAEATDTRVIFTLSHSEETKAVYPFSFLLTVVYELVGNELKKTCTVENLDDALMYFELGGHDGFTAPHAADQTMADCAILLPGYDDGFTPYGMDEACMITPKGDKLSFPGGRVPLKPMQFGLDTFIMDSPESYKAILVGKDNKPLVTLHFPDFPYLGIWTMHMEGGIDTNYVCIEPWSTLPDTTFVGRDLSEKAGIRALQPGEKIDLTYTTTFHI